MQHPLGAPICSRNLKLAEAGPNHFGVKGGGGMRGSKTRASPCTAAVAGGDAGPVPGGGGGGACNPPTPLLQGDPLMVLFCLRCLEPPHGARVPFRYMWGDQAPGLRARAP